MIKEANQYKCLSRWKNLLEIYLNLRSFKEEIFSLIHKNIYSKNYTVSLVTSTTLDATERAVSLKLSQNCLGRNLWLKDKIKAEERNAIFDMHT